ncbi:hypothetical protein QP938_02015 [Porticoccaceae bacterium LTM1]|nr:hypothetical protein QP938_02015 [Porticoccaceae bacterium LTM1]
MDRDAKLRRLGVLHLSLGVLVAVVVPLLYSSLVAFTGDWALVLALVAAVPQIVAGVMLLKGKRYFFPLAMIAGAISLASIPLGTVLGLYTFSVLTTPEDGGEDDLTELP